MSRKKETKNGKTDIAEWEWSDGVFRICHTTLVLKRREKEKEREKSSPRNCGDDEWPI